MGKPGRNRIDLTSKRFGRLSVLKEVGQNKGKAFLWECRCDCGNIIIATCSNLRSGSTNSCGCLKNEIIGNLLRTHGMSGTTTYCTWKNIIKRCTYQNSKDYKDYGGRGITVCTRWLKFENFMEDMGERPSGLSIDRKNNDLGYFKENCHWTTPEIQARNKRTPKNNKTGIKGVCWHEVHKRYRAQITANSETISLGTFKTIEEAIEARRLGEVKYWGESHA